MKLIAFFLIVCGLHVSAKSDAQRVTLDLTNVSLEQVFEKIQAQTSFNFLFQEELLSSAKKVTIKVKNATVSSVLEICFRNQPFTFEMLDKAIIVKRKQGEQTSSVENPPIDVSGKVLYDNGEPIVGASVKVKGYNIGTSTNTKGEFLLLQVQGPVVLVISGAELQTQEITVSNSQPVVIRVNKKISELDQLVVIAYGSTTKRFNTGNIATVKEDDIAKQPVNNPLLALQGRVPGLTITQNSGLPGGGLTVRIQGQNSIDRGSDPLYVIDGVPYISQMLPNISGSISLFGSNGNTNTGTAVGGGNPLAFISVTDIESINILKDADATAIYGSRAANGAILITTKKGQAGRTAVNINVQSGTGKIIKMVDLLNTRQYLDMRYQAFKNDGRDWQSPSVRADDLKIWDTTRYTNWQKELIGGTASIWDAKITVSGGTGNTNFLISGGYHGETTVLPGNLGNKKASVHFNLNHKSSDQRFRIGMDVKYLFDKNKLITTELTQTALRLAPNAPSIYNSDGSLNWAKSPTGSSTWLNPMSYLLNTLSIKNNNLIANFSTAFTLLPGLDISSNFGYTSLQGGETAVLPLISSAPEVRPNTPRMGIYGDNSISSWIIEPQITYKRRIASGNFEVLLGTSIQQSYNKSRNLLGQNYNSDEVLEDINSAGLITLYLPTINSVYKYNAVFGRVNYNLSDRYIININTRRDGSSRFGSANLFQTFGSIGGAWIFSNESFFKSKPLGISFGKLRASYGTTGNDQIGDYQFMNLYQTYTAGITSPFQGTPGMEPVGLPNPNLQWEKTIKLQAGLDLSAFEDRISLNTSYYRNRSSNLLLSYTLPSLTGNTAIQRNFPGTIQNSGWEFSLLAKIISRKEFNWSANINLTIPKNKLVAFPDLDKSTYSPLFVIGESINIRKVYNLSGVDATTGIFGFLDSKGNIVSAPTPDDKTLISVDPVYYGGLQNQFIYKEFSLDFLIQFVKKTGYNYGLGFRPGNFVSSVYGSLVANQPVSVLDHWQAPGDIAYMQRFSAAYPSSISTPYSYANNSSGVYSDASFIRLKNISLSYDIPKNWVRKLSIQNGRIFINAQNLITITKYKGFDPDNTGYTNLPPLKVIVFGLQVGL